MTRLPLNRTEHQAHWFCNIPARHSIGQDRFSHWFDAPGMGQRFTFEGDQIAPRGKLIDSQRSGIEFQANEIRIAGGGFCLWL